MNLVLFDFDKTIINKDIGAAYMKYMLVRNPCRLAACVVMTPFVLLFLPFNNAKFIGYSVWLWLVTVGMSNKKLVGFRNKFITQFLDSETTMLYEKAVERLVVHTQNMDTVVVVSGASSWMVKKVFTRMSLPKVGFACSKEGKLAGGMVSHFHCYSQNKVVRINQLFNINDFSSIIGYSDSAVDIPILTLCTTRVVVNPQKKCLFKLRKSFNHAMSVVKWE